MCHVPGCTYHSSVCQLYIISIYIYIVSGVTISDKLSISDHIRTVIGQCAQSLYALKMLRAHGLNNQSIQTIFNSIIMSKLVYASPAWSGFANKEDQQRIDSFLRKSSKSAFAPPDLLPFSQLSADIDDKLFKKISSDDDHVLHSLLPPVCDTGHNLRRRNHPFVLPAKAKSALQEKNFMNRVLYKNSY